MSALNAAIPTSWEQRVGLTVLLIRAASMNSIYLHELSAGVYDELSYYHDIRGIQEICERKNMKLAIAKYLELYKRTNYRPKKRSKKKVSKTL